MSKMRERLEREGRTTTTIPKVEMTNVMFTLTEPFRDAIDEFATQQKISRAELVRRAVAQFIDYPLADEVRSDAKRKYASVEERKTAYKQRNKDKRSLFRQLLAEYQQRQREEEMAALEESANEVDDVDEVDDDE